MTPPDSSVKVSDFTGLVDNIDPRDPPPGASPLQENACCVKQGELQIRMGYKILQFEVQT